MIYLEHYLFLGAIIFTIGVLGTTTAAEVRDEIIIRINAGTSIGFTASASGDNVQTTTTNKRNTSIGLTGSVGGLAITAGGTTLGMIVEFYRDTEEAIFRKNKKQSCWTVDEKYTNKSMEDT